MRNGRDNCLTPIPKSTTKWHTVGCEGLRSSMWRVGGGRGWSGNVSLFTTQNSERFA